MTISQTEFNQQLKSAGIAITFSELHGFLTGLICGGIDDHSWQQMLYQFTNDNHAYPTALLEETNAIHQNITNSLSDMESFDFELGIVDDENVFARADSLSEWSNYFLLGLGLAQPHLDKEKDEIGEAVDDLRDICHLGYNEDDDEEEMSEALEEIIEYLRTIAVLFYTQFNQTNHVNLKPVSAKPVLH